MKLRRRAVFTDLSRPRVGLSEVQERKARDDVRLNRHLVSVMSGATAFSHTKRASTASTVSPRPGGKS
jgi:hypothetical protein